MAPTWLRGSPGRAGHDADPGMPLHGSLRLMAGVLIVGALGLLVGYWIHVERSNAGLRQDVLTLAQQHAEQLADAVARQAEDLLHGIDTGLRRMRDAYRQDARSFEASRRATLGASADDAIADIEVLDASGEAVDGRSPAGGLTGRGERDHVLAQAASAADQLRVGPAIPGQVGEGWTIPVSRKLMRDGRFDGVVVVFQINVIDKDDPVRRRHVAVISDITARKRSEEMAWWRANYDELTELPNRRLLIDRLEHALVGAERHDHNVAVLFIDLDEFKPINDRFGHQAGDEVLKQVGSRMKLCTRKEDTVARLGGDEFVVMLATTRTEDDALRVAQKILKELHGPFQVGDKLLKIGASIGVAFSPRHGQTAEALLKKADAAMYAAKAAGRHTLRVHADDTAGSAGAGASAGA